ncbi:translocation/assembly module TamB domain-containing protein [Trichocoleus sp. FACHB-832]|uniref:translocation/assembly module TamB domain-containing protein n=1 Tax=Trichocoleus sp. FACHB-832 TaxID=2692875 RepID=UPI001688AF25|nr:translocation/assembly module TamB domain-containing protein [Trichocoleus sp. FACHB-832]MBD1905421.1 translocation/assembly module TamB domain-containing protein [Trichocoleus sp. FACHB-832]
MTNSPNPGNEPATTSNRRVWLLLLSRTGIALGLFLLVGIAGGVWWAWVFVHQRLAPIVQENLSQTLNRPVQLGQVEGFSPNSLRFRSSSIPATPTDPDRASVEGVKVVFDPLALLFNRTLKLDITLVKPDVYIEQDEKGRWVSTQLESKDASGPITTELQSIRVQNADVLLLPRLKKRQGKQGTNAQSATQQRTPQNTLPDVGQLVPTGKKGAEAIAFTQVNGGANFLDQNQRIRFNASGLPVVPVAPQQQPNTTATPVLGNLKISGEYRPPTGQTNLLVQGQNLSAVDVDRLVKLPLYLQAGLVDGNLEIQLRDEQRPTFKGTAGLKNVTAQVGTVPRPFTNANGILRFNGYQIGLENVTTLYGQVPAVANGIIDTKTDGGYNIAAQTKPVTLTKALDTLKVNSPVPVSGEVRADLQLKGSLEKPILSGTAVTTKPTEQLPLKIDKVNFQGLSGQFQLAGSTLSITDIRALPSVGGKLTGNGRIQLGEKGGLVFDVLAQQVPGDAVAQIYGVKPTNIQIGTVTAKSQVFGTPGNLQTVVQFQAPQATYPGSGEVIVTEDTTFFRNTTLNVGGGIVKAKGQLNNGRWQASGIANDVQLARLSEVPPQLQSAQIDGTFNLSGNFGSSATNTIDGTAQGRVNIAGGTVTASNVKVNNGRWQASGQASGVQLAKLFPQLPPQFQGQLNNGSFNLAGNLENVSAETIRGTASGRLNVGGGTVNAANVQLNNGRWQASGQASGVQLAKLFPQLPPQFQGQLNNGSFNLAGNLENVSAETIRGTASGRLNLGAGSVTATNVQLNNGRWQASGQATDVQLARLFPQIPPQFQGRLRNGSFNLSGSLENVSPETISGTASGRLNLGGGTVNAANVQLNNGRWQASGEASGVQLARVFPQLPSQFQGQLNNGSFNLSGSLENVSPETISGTASGRLNLGGGTVNAANVQLNNGRWQASGEASNVQLARLFPQFQGKLNSGSFNLSGSLAASGAESITGTASGNLNLGGGTVNAANVQLNNGRWQASGEASNVQLAEVFPQLPSQFQGRLNNGSFNLSGSLAASGAESITGTASGSLNLGGGTVNAANVQLNNGRWQASGQADGVQLARVFPQLPSQFQGQLNNGSFNLSGSLAAFTPASLTGTASGSLNVGGGTITASNIQLQDGRWQGTIAANDVALEELAEALPASSPIPDVQGRVSGTLNASGSLLASNPAAIQATGQVRVEDLVAYELDFDPVLTGQVNLVPGQRSSFELTGNQNDQISLVLSPNYQPLSFLLKRDDVVAQGDRRGDLFVLDVENVPLALLKDLAPENVLARLPAAIASQPIGGKLSGDITINLENFSVVGNDIAIAQPVFGTFKGTELTIDSFSYANGSGTLTRANFTQGESEYSLGANFNQTPRGPEFKLALNVEQGKIQDVLPFLQIFDLQDLARGGQPPTYARAAAVKPQPVGLQNATLQNQLRLFSEIEAILAAQQEERNSSGIPELADLTGNFFTAEPIIITASPQEGIEARFNLVGTDWKWGKEEEPNRLYKADQIVAKGSFQDGVLTLLPLRVESDETLVAFNGIIGGDEQSGLLRVANLPVSPLRRFVNVPFDIEGQLNGTAAIAGTITNPQAKGELRLADARLNQTEVETARGSFQYSDARLTFSSTIDTGQAAAGTTLTENISSPQASVVTPPPSGFQCYRQSSDASSQSQSPSATRISGSIPFYNLPFPSVTPDNNCISLDVNVKNEGLSLLNLLSRSAVSWKDGTGQVQLRVDGAVDPTTGRINQRQLVAAGSATVKNATIEAQALPEPLTDVNGTVRFNFDRLNVVEELRGNFSGGQVVVSGSIPLSDAAQGTNGEQITVNLEKLALNLKGLYNGGVNGNVQISGSALSPQIGGQVLLADGRVLLGETRGGGGNGAASAPNGGAATEAAQPLNPGFNNLLINLGEGVEISRPPLLAFLAEGDLRLNGTLDDIEPSGTIRLKRGQVNLFTTQFRLASGYEHTAVFVPGQGLDPNLDVRLVASVPEVTRSRIATISNTGITSNEISDVPATNLGALGTVRIQARVTGAASELADNLDPTSNQPSNLELTSNPSRSETEIVALLGGSFVDTLGGDATLGLANLAGSALLTPFQNVVGDALGLSEFRLFPTQVTDDKSRTSTLGLAAELGVDITPKLSGSVSKVLTNSQAPQFNVRYRVNDEILLRGGTDLSDDHRAVLEYEKRF